MNTYSLHCCVALAAASVILNSGCSAVRVATFEFHQQESGSRFGYDLPRIERAGGLLERPRRPNTFETKVGWVTRYFETGLPVIPKVNWEREAFQYQGAVQFLRLGDGVADLGGAVERATLRFTRRVPEAGEEPLRRILVASSPWPSGYHADTTPDPEGLETTRAVSFVRDMEIPFRQDGEFIEADVTRVVRLWESGKLPNHGFLLHSEVRRSRSNARRTGFYNDFVLEVRTREFVTVFSNQGRVKVRRGTLSTR